MNPKLKDKLETLQRLARAEGGGRTYTVSDGGRGYFVTATTIKDITIPGPDVSDIAELIK